MKIFYTIFLLIVIVASGLVYFFRAGWHPLALVNSRLVWAWEFEKEYQSALKYHDEAASTYKITGLDKQTSSELKNDTRTAVFNRIIEKILISRGLKDLAGESGSALIDKKIEKYLSDSRLEAAALALFNLNFKDFKEVILVPQAEKEIIEEKLKEESRDFKSWLEEKKSQARVYIFTSEFEWSGNGVKRQG